jgi:hypothetical protein
VCVQIMVCCNANEIALIWRSLCRHAPGMLPNVAGCADQHVTGAAAIAAGDPDASPM